MPKVIEALWISTKIIDNFTWHTHRYLYRFFLALVVPLLVATGLIHFVRSSTRQIWFVQD